MKKLLTTTALVFTMAMAGMAYADKGSEHGGWHDGPPPFMEEAINKLPAAKAEAFKATMKKSHEKNEKLSAQSKKLHEEMRAIVTAEKFDKAAFLAKSGELQKVHDQMHVSMTESLAEALSSLSQDERKTLSDNMHFGSGEHHHHKGGRDLKAKDNEDASGPSPDKAE